MRYDYYCPVCNFEKEVTHSMKENPLVACPKCKHKMERKIGNPQVLFKDSNVNGPWTWEKKSRRWFNSAENERVSGLGKRTSDEKEKEFYSK